MYLYTTKYRTSRYQLQVKRGIFLCIALESDAYFTWKRILRPVQPLQRMIGTGLLVFWLTVSCLLLLFYFCCCYCCCCYFFVVIVSVVLPEPFELIFIFQTLVGLCVTELLSCFHSYPIGFPIIPIVISLIIGSSGEKGLESYTNENL